MAQGRGKAEWGRASALLALLVNINRDPKKSSPAKPSDLNPYLFKKPHRIERLDELKEFFVPKDLLYAKDNPVDCNMASSGINGGGVQAEVGTA
jgi:hypothetical protein